VSHGIREPDSNLLTIIFPKSVPFSHRANLCFISGLAAWCDPISPLLTTVRIALKYPGTQNRFFLSEFKDNLKRPTQHVQRILNWERSLPVFFADLSTKVN
jgi:hypothetical protein